MTIDGNWHIFLVFSTLSLIISLFARRFKVVERTDEHVLNEKLVQLAIFLMLFYGVFRAVSGWRLSNIYLEASLFLILFICLDYLITVRNKYSKRTNVIFYVMRYISIVVPIGLIGLVMFATFISFGYGAEIICKVYPLDTSYGEQNVYRNFYIYKDECDHKFIFKKTFLLFEKDVASFPNDAITHAGGGIDITCYKNDSITITGHKENNVSEDDHKGDYLKVRILPANKLKVERITFPYDRNLNGVTTDVEESFNVNL